MINQDYGVAEISDELTLSGIVNEIESTGGGIECVFVYSDSKDSRLMITDGAISFYPDETLDYVEHLEFFNDNITVSDIEAATRSHLHKVRLCIVCTEHLKPSDVETCEKCVHPSLSNTCHTCGGGRGAPVKGEWCEDMQGHATLEGGK